MTTFKNTIGTSIQLKSGQLKQCDSNGTNLFPITKVDNVLMEDGRTLTQFLASLKTTAGLNIEVTTNYKDGLVIGSIRIDNVTHYLIVPYAGISTVITENGNEEQYSYVGVPNFNPDDFFFNDANEVSTIIDFAPYNNENLVSVGKIIDGSGNKKTDIKLPRIQIVKSFNNDGDLNIRISSWGMPGSILISGQEIYNMIKNLISNDTYELSSNQSENKIEVHLLKNGEVDSSVFVPISKDYRLTSDDSTDGYHINLLKGNEITSTVTLSNDIFLSISDRNIYISNGAKEAEAELPVATGDNYGVAIYDGQVQEDKKPVYIENGRPYVEKDAIDTTQATSTLFLKDDFKNTTYYKELNHRLFYPKLYYADVNDFSSNDTYRPHLSASNIKIAGNKISVRCAAIACRGYMKYEYLSNGIMQSGIILFALDTPPSEVCGIMAPRVFSCNMYHSTTTNNIFAFELTLNDSNVSSFVIKEFKLFTYKGSTINVNGISQPNANYENDEPYPSIDFSVNYELVDEIEGPDSGSDTRKFRYIDVALKAGEVLTEKDIYDIKFLEYESRIKALEARL